MSDFDKQPTDAATRNDDEVGSPGGPAAGGGRQTPEQAAVTGTGSEGLTDADRKAQWKQGSDQAGRNPAPVGGSSDGQSDRRR